jgi:hypothetical protein
MIFINGKVPSVHVEYSKIVDGVGLVKQPSIPVDITDFPDSVEIINPLTGDVVGSTSPDEIFALVLSVFKDIVDNPEKYEDLPEDLEEPV